MVTDNPRVKLAAGILWIAAIAAGFLWAHFHGYGAEQVLRLIYRFVTHTAFGPLIYIVLYCLRPFIFFPAMFLTMMSGSIFGFWGGWALTIVGENSSANVAYFIGRFFGGETVNNSESRFIQRWRPALEEQAIPTVIILRAAYLPFDLVNYACGLISLSWPKYFIGTFIGILPPMVTFVAFGSSIDTQKLLANLNHFHPASLFNEKQLLISIGLFVFSLTLARIVHVRHRKNQANGN